MCWKARQSCRAICDDLLQYDYVVEIQDKIHRLFAYYVLSLKYIRSMPSIRYENVFLPTTIPTFKSQCCLCLITYPLYRKQVLQNKIPNFPDAYILLIIYRITFHVSPSFDKPFWGKWRSSIWVSCTYIYIWLIKPISNLFKGFLLDTQHNILFKPCN